jgi:hypothetical protein
MPLDASVKASVMLYAHDPERRRLEAAWLAQSLEADVRETVDLAQALSLVAQGPSPFACAVFDLQDLDTTLSPVLVHLFTMDPSPPTVLVLPGAAEDWHIVADTATTSKIYLVPCSRVAFASACEQIIGDWQHMPAATHELS